MKQTLILEKQTEKNKLELLQEEYAHLKLQLQKQMESETLKKYKILSRAYKIGKILYGKAFTARKLSQDFQVPYTTTKRVLSLDRMTPKTKRLLHEGKISASQVAQICSTKSRHFQDEMVKLVIDKKLSSVDIKKLKPKSIDDMNKYRFDKAIQSGFARQRTAYISFINNAEKFEMFLESSPDLFPAAKRGELKNCLLNLRNKIDQYLEKLQEVQNEKENKKDKTQT